MKHALTILLFILITACDGESNSLKPDFYYLKENEELIKCSDKYDSKNIILYYKSNATLYKPRGMPVEIYYIKDVKDVLHSVNNYEIENYKCVVITE